MNSLRSILWATFLIDLAVMLTVRGVQFHAVYGLGMTERSALALSLAFGVLYVIGALLCHRLTRRLGEKRLLQATLVLQAAAALAMTALPSVAPGLFVANAFLGLANGLLWPVVESYVAAGKNHRDVAQALGKFALTWSAAYVVGLILAGPIVGRFPAGAFGAAAVLLAVSLAIVQTLPPRPRHWAPDHPDRPAPETLVRWRGLLSTGRWLMLLACAMVGVLSAMLPVIFHRFGCSADLAGPLSSIPDAGRFAMFLILWVTIAWHGKAYPLILSMAALPAGMILILLGSSLPAVLVGEGLIGLALGTVYFAALYYALVVRNAQVEAGGVHEGLIGSGMAFGPAAGLAGITLAGPSQSTSGMLIALCVLAALAIVMALRSLGFLNFTFIRYSLRQSKSSFQGERL